MIRKQIYLILFKCFTILKNHHSHTGGVSPAQFEEAYFSELQTV